MVQTVVGDDGVDRAAVGDSGGVGAETREGDFEGLGGVELVGFCGVGWEVVGGKEVAEVFDLEEGGDGGEGGGVWEFVGD